MMERVQVQLSTRKDGRIVARLDLVGIEFRDLRNLTGLLRGVPWVDVSAKLEAERTAVRVGRALDDRLAGWSPF